MRPDLDAWSTQIPFPPDVDDLTYVSFLPPSMHELMDSFRRRLAKYVTGQCEYSRLIEWMNGLESLLRYHIQVGPRPHDGVEGHEASSTEYLFIVNSRLAVV